MTPLKRARLLSGKRQIDVYNEIDIWPARLSMLENGLLKPRQKELHLLAKAYNTTPDQLYGCGKHQEGTVECRVGVR